LTPIVAILAGVLLVLFLFLLALKMWSKCSGAAAVSL
jgi:hypothetical protein